MRTIPLLPEATRVGFLAAVRAYRDTPWAHMQRSKRGVDCIGLVISALRDIDVPVDEPPPYPREPNGTLRDGLIERLGQPVAKWRAGDIALMKWGRGQHTHVGVLDVVHGEWHLIHAYLLYKRVVEHRLDDRWARRVTDVFSLTGGAR